MSTEDNTRIPKSISSLFPPDIRCEEAWNEALAAAIEQGSTQEQARKLAAEAFRESMPRLLGNDNICFFVDCVARGIVLGVFTAQESTRLLYAAQVALSARNKLPQPQPVMERRHHSPYLTADQLNQRRKLS